MVTIISYKVLSKKNGKRACSILCKNNFKVIYLNVRKTPNGQKQSVVLEDEVGMCHCWVTSEGLGVAVITDMDYPEQSAYNMIGELVLDFMETFKDNPAVYMEATKDIELKYEKLEMYLKNWQNPADADKLYKIKTDLSEVKEIMHKNMQELLERGESLESLMSKSKDLSKMSNDFYKKAKKKNQRCCSLS